MKNGWKYLATVGAAIATSVSVAWALMAAEAANRRRDVDLLREEVRQLVVRVEKRLDRIESKIDLLSPR